MKLTIKMPEDDLHVALEHMKREFSPGLHKTWSCGTRTVGFFFRFHPIGSAVAADYLSSDVAAFGITFEYTMGELELQYITSFVSKGMFLQGLENTLLDASIERWIRLADEYGWETDHVPHKFKGDECPQCGAIYTYENSEIDENSQVSCQNCGKRFSVEK
jgi:hypothetical protein